MEDGVMTFQSNTRNKNLREERMTYNRKEICDGPKLNSVPDSIDQFK